MIYREDMRKLTRRRIFSRSSAGWIALIVSLILLFGGAEQTFASLQAVKKADSSEQTVRILMIGNSYTGYNNLPGMLQKICTGKGKKVEVAAVTKPKACLNDFASRTTDVGKRVHRLLKKQKWDYVILQERHYYPLTNASGMEKAVCSLLPYIEASGAQMALYMTWAPEKGHKDYQMYSSLVSGRYSYQKKIAVSYRKIADKTNAILIPVGLAFQNVMKEKKSISLIESDKSHPTKQGSYLAACTMYAAIFHESPEGAAAGTLNKNTAAFLQKMSWRTWKKTRYNVRGNLLYGNGTIDEMKISIMR